MPLRGNRPDQDPRVVNATSVVAADRERDEGAFRITSATANAKMFTLPWGKPLAKWPESILVRLPRGISRHIVRFVYVGSEVDALKEIPRQVAEREYELLRQLQKLDIPCVVPLAVVTGRKNDETGEPLEAILVTQHLRYSLPYRALFARNLRSDTALRLVDALAVLLVRLHLVGFYWGDVSLSNVLFLRDADSFAAFLVDAETGDLLPKLSNGQREYDIDLARTNIIGELMDLNSGNLLPHEIDEISTGDRLVDRYHMLWDALTNEERFDPNEMWKIEERVNHLNELGFDVDELEVRSTEDGQQIRVRPMVVDAGYASRKLMRLTGLDVQENQARRLLNDIDAYKASSWRQNDDLEVVATDWMRDVFEPTARMIPTEYRSTIEPAQFFHDVLTERWLLAEKVGHDVPMMDAVREYIKNKLPDQKIDTGLMDAINADADAGVYDDESVTQGVRDGGEDDQDYDDQGYDDQDAGVWAAE